MIIKLGPKFTDLEIDEIIHAVYKNFKSNPNDRYELDLTETEFIANQELLVLTALLQTFIKSGIKFNVKFLKPMVQTSEISERVKRQIIQIWYVWKIFEIVPDDDFLKYFDIDSNSVKRLINDIGYIPKNLELYTRYGVTPFIPLDFIQNYNELDVQQIIRPIYVLNKVIEDILVKSKCSHPFTSNSLSTIITEELYLNFLDHSGKSSFNATPSSAFFSISFLDGIDTLRVTSKDIQIRKALNFKTECLRETRDFYYNKKKNEFNNTPYIQFSFLDFGQGIPETLRLQYKEVNPAGTDSDILRYALEYNTSRHPILNPNHSINKSIPRGLFDVITIVKRYKGLVILRSGFGKILLNFSKGADVDVAAKGFGKDTTFFPGTLLSIYIPAIEEVKNINMSAIKPELKLPHLKPVLKKYISVTSLVQNLSAEKDKLYSNLIGELRAHLVPDQPPSVLYISFADAARLEKRIVKKLLYFFATDYDINELNNVVLLDGPDKEMLDEVSHEMFALNRAIKNYKIHPLPILTYNLKDRSVELEWLGIYDAADRKKLNNLLFEQYSLAASDFNEPFNISGNVNYFDEHGNLISNLPRHNEIELLYFRENESLIAQEIRGLLEKYDCIKQCDKDSLYLCNGNYYQQEFIDLSNLVNDQNDCDLVSYFLHRYVINKLPTENLRFIGISASSQRILNSLEKQRLISRDDYITIDDQHNFESVVNKDAIDPSKKHVLFCDVVSTGFLTTAITEKLNDLGADLDFIAVIVSTLDRSFGASSSFITKFKDRIITLYEHPIIKIKRHQVNDFQSKRIIRINPHTNIPITLSISETNYDESVIFSTVFGYSEAANEIKISNKFLDAIAPDHIRVGFLAYNNVVHPYFFDTHKILRNLQQPLLTEIFQKINKPQLGTEKIQVFFPRKSGIDDFNLAFLKSTLANHAIESSAIERFGTPEGWRFPHNSDYLNIKVKGNICFILDDGSCSGDSLLQMVDEIVFYEAKEIVLLCFVGRLADHKREFLSRISQLKVMQGMPVNISIYFVSHWHIPTYFPEENPNFKERLWLSDLIVLQNTPLAIKRIAENIIKEIIPKSEQFYKDYKYLPRLRDGSGSIPKKELLLVRDEIGKVIGYRLYTESFVFFDLFMKKYSVQKNTADRYKEIELLCATFIYEPYLYDKISAILPDVAEKIEEFVRVLISNDKIFDKLSYQWDKKDIVHLFFVVFKNQKLVNELTLKRFKSLIKFTQPRESSLNYVLYKLLGYFSIKVHELESKKYDSHIKQLLFDLKDDPDLKEVRKYYNYICSLPSREDFKSQQQTLIHNYERQNEPQLHDQRSSFNHNVSEVVAALRESAFSIEEGGAILPDKINSITTGWFEMLEFINPILRFSSRFGDYLAPYPYYKLTRKMDGEANSLREMLGYIDEVVIGLSESFKDTEKLRYVEKYLVKIQTIIGVNSTFHQIIQSATTDVSDFITMIKAGVQSFSHEIDDTFTPASKVIKLSIPKVYSQKLLIAELMTNLKNHAKIDEGNKVRITIRKGSEKVLQITIANTIADQGYKSSTGEGLKCIKLLSDSSLFGFQYKSKSSDAQFIQTLNINLI